MNYLKTAQTFIHSGYEILLMQNIEKYHAINFDIICELAPYIYHDVLIFKAVIYIYADICC